MDIQKEKEKFEAWLIAEFKLKNHDYALHFVNSEYQRTPTQARWQAWQAAKANAVPNQPTQFNLDEFLTMEEKLKHKGGVIAADLDCFIDYAEMVLEKAKALKEPK